MTEHQSQNVGARRRKRGNQRAEIKRLRRHIKVLEMCANGAGAREQVASKEANEWRVKYYGSWHWRIYMWWLRRRISTKLGTR